MEALFLAMAQHTGISKIFKSSEEVVSMFLGLVIVAVVAGLIFNYFSKKRGVVDVPGVTDQKNLDLGSSLEVNGSKTETGKKVYVVKKGDNLWEIAKANYGSGYNWIDIANENKLKEPGLLVSGQRLVLPVVEVKNSEIANKGGTVITTEKYIVAKGDSLWEISVRAYGDGYRWVDVWKSNKNSLKDPNKLEIGMELILPRVK
jgi:nucleoid-associated protein YgaU